MLRDMIWNLFSQNWQEGEVLLEEQLEYFEQLVAGLKQELEHGFSRKE